MLASSPAEDARRVLRNAYMTVGSRLEPGRGDPDLRQLQLLAEASLPREPSLWTDEAAVIVAAAIASRARADVLSMGMLVIDTYFDDTRLRNSAGLSPDVRSDLLAAAGEYCMALGAAPRASRFGDEALSFALRPGQHYRARAIVACSLALNGEYVGARSLIGEAQRISSGRNWDANEAQYLLLTAEAFVSIADGDAVHLAAVAEEMKGLQPENAFWSYTASALDAVHHVLILNFARAISESMELMYSTRRNRSHRVVRQFLLCVRSGMHIALGEPGAAHTLLRGQETPPMHGICFHAQRALALLALGRGVEVIDETDECVTDAAEHTLRTLVQVLICRAVAYARSGAPIQSARSLEDAFGLIAHTRDWVTPFTMMPYRESAEILTRAAATRPDLVPTIQKILSVLESISAPESRAQPDGMRLLTETEIVVARLLVAGDTLRAIAAARSVSITTVKSQVRSIYRKLEVTTRDAAVDRISSSEIFTGLRLSP